MTVCTMQRCTGTVLVAALVALLSWRQSSLFVTTQSSSLGCSSAYYMLTNSIPKSCNAALHRIISSLPNSSQPVDSGDICTSYCLTPLKQAALECQTIDDIYNTISSRCCWNNYGEQCFSLSGHRTVAGLIAECGHYEASNTTNTDNCSTTCSDAMTVASVTLGCCLPGLLAGSSHQSLLEPALWQWCLQIGPRQPCTHCSGAVITSTFTGATHGLTGIVGLVIICLT